ncbi:acetate/propionate family kinase [Methylacidimicrobium tartarophylax]|uniref:Acetate kinase n=1 Tax=Methylacidimicrobium tartarophylax TaxID=1041768 RepID=A0A5E6MGZ3_9BACT|nr:acetate/propionate family kinase [Methylacidimicrobium tartarophylax]VVM07487.1 acetate kinase [Methylacidimicrobium tartarophylax]
MNDPDKILTINSGSTSLKFALFQMVPSEKRLLSGKLDHIGSGSGRCEAKDSQGAVIWQESLPLPDHRAGLARFFAWFETAAPSDGIDAVGHRLVHGGPVFGAPRLLTSPVLQTLQDLSGLAPDHLPHELEAVRSIRKLKPDLPQVGCFDTAFHRSMPFFARTYALPLSLRKEGLVHYGFHGISCEYVFSVLEKILPPERAQGRIVLAHLGGGASMTAIHGGKSVDTTMGFTPTSGLVMGTRCGDLDPGIVLYLLRERGLRLTTVARLLSEESGLLALSESSGEMRDLLSAEATDSKAAAAVEIFCYQARKFLASLAAALEGLDMLVFTGGIGENAPEIRERICEPLAFLGLQIDRERNRKNEPIISSEKSRVEIRVVPTDEERMIARHTQALVRSGRASLEPIR